MRHRPAEATTDSIFPDEVALIRFRISEVALNPTDGPWETWQANTGLFESSTGSPGTKNVLAADIRPVTYDSLALSFERIFVQYDANSGGPLIMQQQGPVHIQVPFRARQGQPVTLHLRFEPDASLWKDARCKWHFMPFLVPTVETGGVQ